MRARSVLWSMNYAIEGIVFALRTQRNMRLHALAATLVLGAALLLGVESIEMIVLVFAISFVLATELINTALEAGLDAATDHYDPLVKTAKDVAAGAVLIASINAVVVGYLVFFDKLTEVAEDGLDVAASSPPHLTIIALGLTAIAVLALKAATKEGSFLRGGWPSGHTALAVSAATAIAFSTNSAKAAVLAFFMAALVAQSRVESDTHTIPQVVFGAVLGFLITTFVFQVALV